MKNPLKDIEQFYLNKLKKHGSTALGVGWNGQESQEIRFKQLLSICNKQEVFSIADIGCGYGALYPFLEKQGFKFEYLGVDTNLAMLKTAEEFLGSKRKYKLFEKISSLPNADYAIASGIFNIKLNNEPSEWTKYVTSLLEEINSKSEKGFSFNLLTKYSDAEKMKTELYYADPLFYFDFCKTHFSKNVALLHDYGLYEFTILVRKL